MASRYSHAVALALLAACSHHPVDESQQPTGDDPGVGSDPGTVDNGTVPDAGPVTDAGPGTGSDAGPGTGSDAGPGTGSDGGPAPGGGDAGDGGTPVAACPIGAATFTVKLGVAFQGQGGDLAVDSAGNVLFATAGRTSSDVTGITKLSPSGDVLYTRPFGSVVATDRAGNAYIAGAFSAPLDVGLGVMQPDGNVDVFVAKLDAAGNVVFAVPLRLCGDGVQSIAVDASGRIAVSGTAMGTAVLSPTGEILFVVPLAGDVAFNSRGDLIIAGSGATTIDLGDGPIDATNDGYVIELDSAGKRIFSQLLVGNGVHTTSVAVDSKDDIVVVGYAHSIVLFGDAFQSHVIEGSEIGGGYVVKLDASGQLVWKNGFGTTEHNAVTVDASDNIVIAGADTGNLGFRRLTELVKVDPADAPLFTKTDFPATGYGRGVSVATDACGSVYTAVLAVDTLGLPSPVSAYIVKVAP